MEKLVDNVDKVVSKSRAGRVDMHGIENNRRATGGFPVESGISAGECRAEAVHNPRTANVCSHVVRAPRQGVGVRRRRAGGAGSRSCPSGRGKERRGACRRHRQGLHAVAKFDTIGALYFFINKGGHAMNKAGWRQGVAAGIPLAIGYIPIAMAYGVLAATLGIPSWFIAASSILVFAGASQFMVVNMIPLGATVPELVMTTFVVNLRHLLLSAAVAAKTPPATSRRQRTVIGALTTDELFSLITLRAERYVSAGFILALGVVGYTSWWLGTIAGLLAVHSLPPLLADSMGIGLYAMFIAMLVPALKRRPDARLVTALAIGGHAVLASVASALGLGPGIALLVAALAAVVAATGIQEVRR